MKFMALLFFAGLVSGVILSIVKLRKAKTIKKTERFECGICDEKNCECHKKDE